MMSQIEAFMSAVDTKLQQLGITLPTPAAPVANYVPFVRTGNLIVISGQLCLDLDGKLADAHKGKLGAEISPEIGQEAARLCAINLLAQLKAAVGDLDKVTRCVRLGGFINSVPTFAALAPIMNGASDLMVEVLGDAGRHARSTIGVAELPLDACVEVEGMFEVK
jgi:enamine deaminase RidA (YjgF/YER057c/UK114 family)